MYIQGIGVLMASQEIFPDVFHGVSHQWLKIKKRFFQALLSFLEIIVMDREKKYNR